MDKLEQYQNILADWLQDKAILWSTPTNSLHTLPLVNQQQQHFQLLQLGWQTDTDYVHLCLYHLELRGEKIWIHANNTDQSITEELISYGIEALDIVITFINPVNVNEGYNASTV
ncbi:MAG: element excision factor XisI family protein [Bacteroidota bacterium]